MLNPFLNESFQAYHKARSEHLTSHQLIDYIRSPAVYHAKMTGQIADEETDAFRFGRALHTLVLEGQSVFDSIYAVGGPINEKTGRPFGAGTQAFEKWAKEQNKQCVHSLDYEHIKSMAAAVKEHPAACNLLSHGFAESVVRVTIENVKCQARIDWYNPDFGIVDLKTCDEIDWFSTDIRRWKYDIQMAFYNAVLKAAATDFALDVHLIAVEKQMPYRVGVWKIDSIYLTALECRVIALISAFRKSRETNHWPTGFEEIREYKGE